MGYRSWWLGLSFVALMNGCFEPEDSPEGATDTGTGGTSMGSAPTTDSGVTSMTTTSASTTGETSTTTSSTNETSPTSQSSTSSTATDSDSASTTTGASMLECVESNLGSMLGDGVANIVTTGLPDAFTGSCGGTNTPDVAYEWVAPNDDFYVFDTRGSSFDTVLYLLGDDCDGAELICSDNGFDGVYSEAVAELQTGDRVVVVIDGVAGEDGDAVLNINPVACPTADLAGQPLPQTFSNQGAGNNHGGACGGDGPERSFRYTAEVDGLYSFRAQSDAFNPSLYLEVGPLCGGPELQCNAGTGLISGEVVRELEAGDNVTIIVDSDGAEGEFDLDVIEIPETCADVIFDGNSGFFTGDIFDFEHVQTTSCGLAGDPTGSPEFPAATISWTSPMGFLGCSVFVDAGFPFSVSLQEGTCDGPEIECEASMMGGGGGWFGSVGIGQIPPTEFTVVVVPQGSPMAWMNSTFDVSVACFQP